jgi:hypothetical protein
MVASRIRRLKGLETLNKSREGVTLGVFVAVKRIFGFLSPLFLFIPVTITGQNPTKSRKDWTLSLLAAGYGIIILITAGISVSALVLSGLIVIRD